VEVVVVVVVVVMAVVVVGRRFVVAVVERRLRKPRPQARESAVLARGDRGPVAGGGVGVGARAARWAASCAERVADRAGPTGVDGCRSSVRSAGRRGAVGVDAGDRAAGDRSPKQHSAAAAGDAAAGDVVVVGDSMMGDRMGEASVDAESAESSSSGASYVASDRTEPEPGEKGASAHRPPAPAALMAAAAPPMKDSDGPP
jgi:hypothetical protein